MEILKNRLCWHFTLVKNEKKNLNEQAEEQMQIQGTRVQNDLMSNDVNHMQLYCTEEVFTSVVAETLHRLYFNHHRRLVISDASNALLSKLF